MHDRFVKETIKEAKKALDNGEVPVGAIIVCDNKIIARGYNSKEKDNNVLKHAELSAISKASKKNKDWRLNECVIYTTLFPCPMCASAIQQSRLKKVFYINDSLNSEASRISKEILSNKKSNHQVIIEKIDVELDILNDFFVNIRNKK